MNREEVTRDVQERYRQGGRSLNEFQRRHWAAWEALKLGRGGITLVSQALSRPEARDSLHKSNPTALRREQTTSLEFQWLDLQVSTPERPFVRGEAGMTVLMLIVMGGAFALSVGAGFAVLAVVLWAAADTSPRGPIREFNEANHDPDPGTFGTAVREGGNGNS